MALKMDSWQLTGNLDPQDLWESRLQLHYAVQFLAATSAALVEPQEDWSHTSLSWFEVAEEWVFITAPISCERPFQVALEPLAMTLMLVDLVELEPIARLPLHEKTMAEGLSWLKRAIAVRGGASDRVEFLSYPDDFPHHPLANGGAFADPQTEALEELARYYCNGNLQLDQIASRATGATPVRIWPHHFDIAISIDLALVRQGEPASITVGLSPGDQDFTQPYWYVTLWPYPESPTLPDLPGGAIWQTKGWIGAVLTASQMTTDTVTLQSDQVMAYLTSAIEATRLMLMS